MKRILVTGANGFVGRQIIKHLNSNNFRIIAIVRVGSENKLFESPNIERIISSKDIFSESEEWWTSTCAGVDQIIHAAWYVEPGKYLQSPKNIECLIGSIKMAHGAVKAGVKHIIGIGTCFEYELDGGYLSIDTPLNPLTPYAAAKASLYFILKSILSAEKVKFTWCRLFYLYGEGEDERRLVPYIRKNLSNGKSVNLTSGNQIRDYIDVCEVGNRIVNIAVNEHIGVFNICSGEAISVRQLAEKIADEYEGRRFLNFGAHPENVMDPSCVVGVANK